MRREDLEAFLQRDWALARRVKDASLGALVRRRGATTAFRLAQMLLDQTWTGVSASGVEGLLAYTERLDRARAARR